MKSDEACLTARQVRKKYINFFKKSPRDHKEIGAAPLVPKDDPTTLFTSAGMQPLVSYLMGEVHSEGKRLVSSQPCVRTGDIEEVGDNRHLTFFEMLGNWSLGDYFKKEQLNWIWEFLTKELGLAEKKLWATCFAGGSGVEKDAESYEILKRMGVPPGRINFYEDNWWSRSGLPKEMPEGEIGGPDYEVFYEFEQVIDEKYGKEFHPDSKRFLEIGNSVFIQYKKTKNDLEELPQKNVDFGGGLERLTAAVNDEPDIFKIDVFLSITKKIEEIVGKFYKGNEKEMRIIADHVRAAGALIKEGVEPSNKLQGYVLRRLIRRSAVKMRGIKGKVEINDLNLGFDEKVTKVIEEEVGRFKVSLERGMKLLESQEKVDGKQAFDLFQSYGFPFEVTQEIAEERGQKIDEKEFKEEYRKHQEKSRAASGGMFKGGLADHSEEVMRLHTVTHLLHEALRRVLGEQVSQKGSNITKERARFDFTHDKKLTEDEIAKVEKLINEQIEKKWPVTSEVMGLEEAKKKGALAFSWLRRQVGEKYGEKVKVYSINNFSKEVCGGPHVKNLGEIEGRVRIKKEESVSSGVRRIYAAIEK